MLYLCVPCSPRPGKGKTREEACPMERNATGLGCPGQDVDATAA